MKAYGGMEVYIHAFLTSALLGGECLASRPSRFTPGGSWVGPRTGPDDVEKTKILRLPRLNLRPLGRPARNQSLYRLRCTGFCIFPRRDKDINSSLHHYVQTGSALLLAFYKIGSLGFFPGSKAVRNARSFSCLP
jgi:hypothetical protein